MGKLERKRKTKKTKKTKKTRKGNKSGNLKNKGGKKKNIATWKNEHKPKKASKNKKKSNINKARKSKKEKKKRRFNQLKNKKQLSKEENKEMSNKRKKWKKSRKNKSTENKNANDKQTSEKTIKQTKSERKKGRVNTNIKGNPQPRAVLKGVHCQYIDQCALDTKSANGCDDGDKFVVKGARGKVKTRRQFLILDGKKIIAFLENGKKITDCKGNMTDVTDKVTCKAVTGAAQMKIEKQDDTATPTSCPGKCNIPNT